MVLSRLVLQETGQGWRDESVLIFILEVHVQISATWNSDYAAVRRDVSVCPMVDANHCFSRLVFTSFKRFRTFSASN